MNEEDLIKPVVTPDYTAVCDYLTFAGGTLPEALRKLADWVEQNSVDSDGGTFEEYCVEHIQAAYCDDMRGTEFRLSIQGDWEGETTIKELKEN